MTEASGHVVFLLETTQAPEFGPAVDAAATDLAERLATRSDTVTSHALSPAAPAALLR